MAIGGLVIAALLAAGLGWMGRAVMVLLPESPDAAPRSPSPIVISRTPHLGRWLAGAAFVQVVVVAIAVPALLLPAWIIVCGVGTWLAYIDWHTHVLPTRIVVPLYAVTAFVILLEAWLVADARIFVRALAGSALAFGSFWVLWWIAGRRERDSFGFGDVRFSVPLGLVLGSISGWAAPVGLYLGFAIGAVVGLVLRSRGQEENFAFGPAMVAGAVVGAILCA